MRRSFIAISLAIVALSPAAHAAGVAVTTVQPFAQGRFSDGAGDQASALLTTAKGIYIIGTAEGASADWLSAPKLGGTDGFISYLSMNGLPIWSLRLGGAGDDIATAGVIAKSGEIWVAGVSTPNAAINGALNVLTVWEISSLGKLINTFTNTSSSIINPRTITETTSDFQIVGRDFSIGMNAAGTFSPFKVVSYTEPTLEKLVAFKGTKYTWKIYTGKGPLIGITGFNPKKSATVYYKVLNKGSVVKTAMKFTQEPILVRYQKDIGIYALNESPAGFALSLLK